MSVAHEETPLLVSASGATNTGNVRSQNEDSLLAEYPVFLVSDGMGGHEAGDVASAMVVECFRSFVGRDFVATHEVVDAIAHAQRIVSDLSEHRDRGAGATLTGVIATRDGAGQRAWLAINIGDSRTYLRDAVALRQVTVDHSLLQEALDATNADPAMVAGVVKKNVITRAIGDDVSSADYWLVPLVNGTRILACSDGLTGELTDSEMDAILQSFPSSEDAVIELVEGALDRAGRDNITAVVIDVLEGGQDYAGEVAAYAFDPHGSDEDDDGDTVTRPRSERRARG